MLILTFCIVYLLYCIIPTFLYKIKHNLSNNRNAKNIYLTFDDGPDATYTNELLDLLKDENIKATFFVVANSAKENKKVIDRMIAEGHQIGLHSLEHKSAMVKGIRYTKNDLCKSIEIMKELNIPISYYRPPWGHINIATLCLVKKNNLKLVLWDVMTGDWKLNRTCADIKSSIINQTQNGDIICLHDARGSEGAPKKTILALTEAIPMLKSNYNFELLDKIYE